MRHGPEPPFPEPPPDAHGWPWSRVPSGEGWLAPSDGRWPTISVVTPSFNQGQFIEETIRSVLLQDYPNLEYLIVDGGSKDHTLDVIRTYEPWIAGWISEPDNGQADAINKGFATSSGELLCWLNSDDMFLPGHLHTMATVFFEHPEVEFAFRDIEVGEGPGGETRTLRGELLPFLTMLRTLEVPIPQQGTMWRRAVWDRLGGLDPRWQVVLDREYFLRVARHCRMHYVPGAGAFFRQHERGKSTAELARWADEMPQFYHEFFDRGELPPDIGRLRGETLAAAYLTCAHIAKRVGQPWRRIRFLAKAAICDWRIPLRRITRRAIRRRDTSP